MALALGNTKTVTKNHLAGLKEGVVRFFVHVYVYLQRFILSLHSETNDSKAANNNQRF